MLIYYKSEPEAAQRFILELHDLYNMRRCINTSMSKVGNNICLSSFEAKYTNFSSYLR